MNRFKKADQLMAKKAEITAEIKALMRRDDASWRIKLIAKAWDEELHLLSLCGGPTTEQIAELEDRWIKEIERVSREEAAHLERL